MVDASPIPPGGDAHAQLGYQVKSIRCFRALQNQSIYLPDVVYCLPCQCHSMQSSACLCVQPVVGSVQQAPFVHSFFCIVRRVAGIFVHC